MWSFWPCETLICVRWAESGHSLSNTASESVCLLSVHSPSWFWENHLSKPGFSLGPIYFLSLFPFPLSRVYSLVIKPILGVLRKELPDDDNSHSFWFLKFLASGCPPWHTIFFFFYLSPMTLPRNSHRWYLKVNIPTCLTPRAVYYWPLAQLHPTLWPF